MTINMTTTHEGAGYWLGLPGAFRSASAITLVTGIALHGSRLFVGPEFFQTQILTPTADAIFAVPMITAGVLMAMLWRRAILPAMWEKISYGFVTLFLLLSVVIHGKTIVTWDTSYINAFPAWYPYLAVTYLAAILVFCLTRRFNPARLK
jgi:hypothetical protein